MGASKRYKGKDCAYCGEPGSTSTNDHVVPRSFFLDDQRNASLELPQVPACLACNNKKSALELYVGSSLLIGSNIREGNRYRYEKVRIRLERNKKLWDELQIDAPPQWVNLNGIVQRRHAVKINAKKVEELLRMMVRGLYRYHYDKVLPSSTVPEVQMVRPDAEANLWAQISMYFPQEVPRIARELGDGAFFYTGVQSPALEGFTVWVMGFHGGIPLYGEEEASTDHWWCITRPAREAVAPTKIV